METFFTVATVVLLSIMIVVTIIGLERKLAKERERAARAYHYFSKVLQQVVRTLDANPNFEYKWNQAGSGDVCYRSDDTVVTFSEFPSKFNGFYVNDKEVDIVSLLEVIKK